MQHAGHRCSNPAFKWVGGGIGTCMSLVVAAGVAVEPSPALGLIGLGLLALTYRSIRAGTVLATPADLIVREIGRDQRVALLDIERVEAVVVNQGTYDRAVLEITTPTRTIRTRAFNFHPREAKEGGRVWSAANAFQELLE